MFLRQGTLARLPCLLAPLYPLHEKAEERGGMAARVDAPLPCALTSARMNPLLRQHHLDGLHHILNLAHTPFRQFVHIYTCVYTKDHLHMHVSSVCIYRPSQAASCADGPHQVRLKELHHTLTKNTTCSRTCKLYAHAAICTHIMKHRYQHAHTL